MTRPEQLCDTCGKLKRPGYLLPCLEDEKGVCPDRLKQLQEDSMDDKGTLYVDDASVLKLALLALAGSVLVAVTILEVLVVGPVVYELL